MDQETIKVLLQDFLGYSFEIISYIKNDKDCVANAIFSVNLMLITLSNLTQNKQMKLLN